MEKLRDVLSRGERRELSAMEAVRLLGCSERQFRRSQARYEEEGWKGLLTGGWASRVRSAVETVFAAQKHRF